VRAKHLAHISARGRDVLRLEHGHGRPGLHGSSSTGCERSDYDRANGPIKPGFARLSDESAGSTN
jgi:hypothetical protein